MPKGVARSSGSSGEQISHINMVRLRVTGQGALKLALLSLQDVNRQQLYDIPLSPRTAIQPRTLANFKEQRAKLEIGTNTINDYFRITRIILYSKYFASEFPG